MIDIQYITPSQMHRKLLITSIQKEFIVLTIFNPQILDKIKYYTYLCTQIIKS